MRDASGMAKETLSSLPRNVEETPKCVDCGEELLDARRSRCAGCNLIAQAD